MTILETVPRGPRKPGRSTASRKKAAASAPAVAATLVLDEMLDLNAASPLRAALLERRGADLAVDASGVHHLGAQCAQVLASATLTWAADGASITFAAASEPFGQGARLLGLHSILTSEGTQA